MLTIDAYNFVSFNSDRFKRNRFGDALAWFAGSNIIFTIFTPFPVKWAAATLEHSPDNVVPENCANKWQRQVIIVFVMKNARLIENYLKWLLNFNSFSAFSNIFGRIKSSSHFKNRIYRIENYEKWQTQTITLIFCMNFSFVSFHFSIVRFSSTPSHTIFPMEFFQHFLNI